MLRRSFVSCRASCATRIWLSTGCSTTTRSLLLFAPQSTLPASEPDRRRRSAGSPWPLAVDERWSVYRTDGAWHVTYWVEEWPCVDVGPDVLVPLLLGGQGRRTAAVVMAPVAGPGPCVRSRPPAPPIWPTMNCGGGPAFWPRPAAGGRPRGSCGGKRSWPRPRRLSLLRVPHGDGGRPGRARRRLRRGRASRPPRPSRAAAAVRPAGGGVHLDAAYWPGGWRDGAGGSPPGRRAVTAPPAHRTTTAHLQALYPFLAEAVLGPGVSTSVAICSGRVRLRPLGALRLWCTDQSQHARRRPDRAGQVQLRQGLPVASARLRPPGLGRRPERGVRTPRRRLRHHAHPGRPRLRCPVQPPRAGSCESRS